MPHRTARSPRARSHRLAGIAAAGTLAAALVPALALATGPASATPTCAPAGYTAASSADLLRLDVLNVRPLGLLSAPLAGVTVGRASADTAHSTANHATGQAGYLSAAPAGLTVPAALLNAHAQQDAPPSHPAPDAHSLAAMNSGVLDVGVGSVSASAGSADGYACGASGGTASVASAAVLPGAHGRSLLALPHELNGTAGAGLTTSGGSLASGATAQAGLAAMTVFGGTPAEIGVTVVTEPTLRGLATGAAATSSVTYTSPVLDLALPGGARVTLDAAHRSVDLVTAADAGAVTGLLGALNLPVVPNLPVLRPTQLEMRLSIGDLTRSVHATHVSGSATMLRVQVLLAPTGSTPGVQSRALSGATSMLDLGLAELSVDATAPATLNAPSPCGTAGGYGAGVTGDDGYGPPPCTSPSPSSPPCNTCTHPSGSPSTPPTGGPSTPSTNGPSTPSTLAPTPSPTTSVQGTSGTLPLTGSTAAWFIGAGVGLLLIGRLVMVAARRRTT